MAQTTAPTGAARVLNVPNSVTLARIALSVALFVLLELEYFGAALVVFLIAAGTDWVDGYWARKYDQITQLGRILDPFADKLIICGSFTFLAAAPQLADGAPASGIAAWVAVLVMAREMMVTGLRSFVESRGGDFSARWVGKWKMVFQCAAAALSIVQLTYFDAETQTFVEAMPASIAHGLTATLWIAIVLTIWSGAQYVVAAAAMLREDAA